MQWNIFPLLPCLSIHGYMYCWIQLQKSVWKDDYHDHMQGHSDTIWHQGNNVIGDLLCRRLDFNGIVPDNKHHHIWLVLLTYHNGSSTYLMYDHPRQTGLDRSPNFCLFFLLVLLSFNSPPTVSSCGDLLSPNDLHYVTLSLFLLLKIMIKEMCAIHKML
jgi:hypothetical protein